MSFLETLLLNVATSLINKYTPAIQAYADAKLADVESKIEATVEAKASEMMQAGIALVGTTLVGTTLARTVGVGAEDLGKVIATAIPGTADDEVIKSLTDRFSDLLKKLGR